LYLKVTTLIAIRRWSHGQDIDLARTSPGAPNRKEPVAIEPFLNDLFSKQGHD